MSLPVVTVYTTGPACAQCTQTKRHLDRRGIAFTEVHIDDALRPAIAYLGLKSAPVVIAENADGEVVYWDGYRPDRLDKLLTPRSV